MGEPSDWSMGGPAEERELARLRAWKEAVLWLVANAPPVAWAQGIRKASEAQSGLPEYNLVACVQRAMPKRAPTPAERKELERLYERAEYSAESLADLRALANKNPAWHLFVLRRFANAGQKHI